MRDGKIEESASGEKKNSIRVSHHIPVDGKFSYYDNQHRGMPHTSAIFESDIRWRRNYRIGKFEASPIYSLFPSATARQRNLIILRRIRKIYDFFFVSWIFHRVTSKRSAEISSAVITFTKARIVKGNWFRRSSLWWKALVWIGLRHGSWGSREKSQSPVETNIESWIQYFPLNWTKHSWVHCRAFHLPFIATLSLVVNNASA